MGRGTRQAGSAVLRLALRRDSAKPRSSFERAACLNAQEGKPISLLIKGHKSASLDAAKIVEPTVMTWTDIDGERQQSVVEAPERLDDLVRQVILASGWAEESVSERERQSLRAQIARMQQLLEPIVSQRRQRALAEDLGEAVEQSLPQASPPVSVSCDVEGAQVVVRLRCASESYPAANLPDYWRRRGIDYDPTERRERSFAADEHEQAVALAYEWQREADALNATVVAAKNMYWRAFYLQEHLRKRAYLHEVEMLRGHGQASSISDIAIDISERLSESGHKDDPKDIIVSVVIDPLAARDHARRTTQVARLTAQAPSKTVEAQTQGPVLSSRRFSGRVSDWPEVVAHASALEQVVRALREEDFALSAERRAQAQLRQEFAAIDRNEAAHTADLVRQALARAQADSAAESELAAGA